MRNKKTIAAILIAVLVVVLGIGGYFVLNKEEKTVISEIPTTEPGTTPDQQTITGQGSDVTQPTAGTEKPEVIRTVSLGDEVTLRENETVILDQPEVSVKVIRFINSPCPSGVQCIWSGQAVSFELKVGDRVYKAPLGNLSSDAPYNVTIKDTDYQTFATFVISSK